MIMFFGSIGTFVLLVVLYVWFRQRVASYRFVIYHR